MSWLSLILRYIIVTLVVLVINLVVFTLSPGNWLTAIIPSIVVISTCLPADSPNNNRKRKTNSDNDSSRAYFTHKDLSESLDQQEMGGEEAELHSTLGSVFNAMARDARQDLYSTDITSTEGRHRFQRREKESDSAGPLTEEPVIPKKPLDTTIGNSTGVRIEVTPDGKLHYIFQEGGEKMVEKLHD